MFFKYFVQGVLDLGTIAMQIFLINVECFHLFAFRRVEILVHIPALIIHVYVGPRSNTFNNQQTIWNHDNRFVALLPLPSGLVSSLSLCLSLFYLFGTTQLGYPNLSTHSCRTRGLYVGSVEGLTCLCLLCLHAWRMFQWPGSTAATFSPLLDFLHSWARQSPT